MHKFAASDVTTSTSGCALHSCALAGTGPLAPRVVRKEAAPPSEAPVAPGDAHRAVAAALAGLSLSQAGSTGAPTGLLPFLPQALQLPVAGVSGDSLFWEGAGVSEHGLAPG